MAKRILVVEDDVQIQEIIVEFLSSQHYEVHCANDGLGGYEKFRETNFDLVILDIMMPNLDGYALCKMIRNKDKNIGIIFLTALGSEDDEVKGFDLDVDDYIRKPFSFNVLIKRVEAVLRRRGEEEEEKNELTYGNVTLEVSSYKAYLNNEEVEMTLKEFNILRLLIQSSPMIVSRDILIEKVWGYEYYGDTRVIDAHIKNIRKKIGGEYIKTVKGIGYGLKK
ncbi:response regulator transcription factor [Clostridium gasigenes]|uniref:response regulator transcription factor n=1 Tax=Clostridium gasigenes TaxID=94869 RepID=UPI001C0CDCEB|nr:response regulator transcription factor [Clostridium gasigenes]MBU3108741.1 response regulator transcription factor [Clostridium gasigenes]